MPPPPPQTHYQGLPYRPALYPPTLAYAFAPGAYNTQPTYTFAQGPYYHGLPTHPAYSLPSLPQPLPLPAPILPPPQPCAYAQPQPYAQPQAYRQPQFYTNPQTYSPITANHLPETTMAPSKKRKASTTAPPATKRSKRASTAAPAHPTAPTTSSPIEPCTDGSSHFHRLRCGHVVKTSLAEPPTACATNCVTQPQANPNDIWGGEPFACPVCTARALSMLWKMDVVNLKKQFPPALGLDEYAEWVRANYVRAWERRKEVRLARWVPNSRGCAQLTVKERGMVRWRAGEARAPYPIEEFRRLYERREVRLEFWQMEYKDTTVEEENWEAEPGKVYQGVEKPGVHYPAEEELAV